MKFESTKDKAPGQRYIKGLPSLSSPQRKAQFANAESGS